MENNGASRCPKCQQEPVVYQLNLTQFIVECLLHPSQYAVGNTPEQAHENWKRIFAEAR